MAKLIIDRDLNNWRNKFRLWWSYYWRYVLLFPTLAFGGSYLLSCLLTKAHQVKYVMIGNVSIIMFFNALVSLVIIRFMLGRKYGSFKYSPVATDNPDAYCETKKSSRVVFTVWLSFFWRFMVLASIIGFCLGYGVTFVIGYFDVSSLVWVTKHNYLGNLASLPASLLAFSMIIGRKYRNFAAVLLPN